jgi:hypothetical protein
MGKKESTDRHLNQACRPSVTPSSRSSPDRRPSDARTVENGFVQIRSLNKSAKVVLVFWVNCMMLEMVLFAEDAKARRHEDQAIESVVQHVLEAPPLCFVPPMRNPI